MRSCAVGSLVFAVPLGVIFAVGACRTDAVRPDVPPLTVASPDGAVPLAPAEPVRGHDASTDAHDARASAASGEAGAATAPVKVAFVDVPAALTATFCERLLVAVAKGKVSALGESLDVGDVLVVTHGEPFEAKGSGLLVTARSAVTPCPIRSRPGPEKVVVRASAAPELRFAGGKMAVHLDVDGKTPARISPDLYLGRLEGTAAVAEHTHPTSWEILAAVEASGSFVLDGVEARLSPRQIVFVPMGAKHAWKPDPGSKLVAIQMYAPPGPEQRFVTLAASDRDAASDAR